MKWIKTLILSLLKVPPPPNAPPGSSGSTRVFRAAPNFFRYGLVKWSGKQVSALAGLMFGVGFLSAWGPEDLESVDVELGPLVLTDPSVEWLGSAVLGLEIVAWLGFALQLPVSYALLRLNYEMRWYIVTDRALRIREGLLRVREQTMTFANIQNMTVRQGPLQRLLGIADLEVRTAGGGSGGFEGSGMEEASGAKPMHVGFFRGVDNAPEVRDIIWRAVRRLRDSGLGDPDEPSLPASRKTAAPGRRTALQAPPQGATPATAPGGSSVVEAARSVLEEARALRQTATDRDALTGDASR